VLLLSLIKVITRKKQV